MKRLISLFDYSGAWPSEFAANGWDAWTWDIKHDLDALYFNTAEITLDTMESCDGILAAVPCTDYASSGAQYWPAKDEDGRTEASNRLVETVLKMVDLFEPTDPDCVEEGVTFFWAIENPVGRLSRLFPSLGKPYYFDPCDFAGYLNPSPEILRELDRIREKDGHGVTKEEAEFIIENNAYTKKTGLWGRFNRDIPKKRIEPVKGAPSGSPLMRLGGSSEKTKALRSNTPLGFAKAFFQANENYCYDPYE